MSEIFKKISTIVGSKCLPACAKLYLYPNFPRIMKKCPISNANSTRSSFQCLNDHFSTTKDRHGVMAKYAPCLKISRKNRFTSLPCLKPHYRRCPGFPPYENIENRISDFQRAPHFPNIAIIYLLLPLKSR